MVKVQVIYVKVRKVAPGNGDVLETVGQGIFSVRWEMDIVEQGSGAVRMVNGGEMKESDGAGRESGGVEENASVLGKKKKNTW